MLRRVAMLRHAFGTVRNIRGYFLTLGPLVRLVWRAGRLLSVASLGLTLLSGLVPAANIFILSALLDTLARAPQSGGEVTSPTTSFVLLLAGLAAVNVLGQILERLEQMLSQLQGARVANLVQMLVAEKAVEIDLANFEDPDFHNRMKTAIDQAPYRPKQMIGDLMGSVSMLTTFVSLATALLLWQAWVVPAILVASLASLGISLYFGTAFVNLVDQRAETERRKSYLSTLIASDQAAKEIRLFGLGGFLLTTFRGLLELTYTQDRRLAFREIAYSLPAGMVLAIVQVALIAFAAFQALGGAISVGQFNLYAQSIVQVGGLLPGLMAVVGALHESNLFAARLFDFLGRQPLVEAPRPNAASRSGAISRTPRIEFRDVTFVYPGTARTVLEDVTFEIRPGEAVALVGENGAGKSTLVKLIAGLYEPTEGKILLDGVDINLLDRNDLRSYLSVIFQDYVVYHVSARENVGMGRLDHLEDEARIREAARRSGLDRVVADLPDGYGTVLGRYWRKGHELSGGQRQLVALARALLRNAPILILDEPSAALDIYAEQAFFRRLLEDRSAGQTQTVIFISHRLTTVRRADRILLFKGGRLTESGTHGELLAQDGRYAKMFKLQAAVYNSSRAGAASSDGPDPLSTRHGERP